MLFVPGFSNVADEFFPFYGGAVFYKGAVIEFKLSFGDTVQLRLYGVIVDQFFVPVAVSQFHVVGDGIGKSLAFVGVFFTQGFVDDRFYILAQVVELGVLFGVRQTVRLCFQRFPGRYGIGAFHIQFKIGYQEKVIPQFVPEILHVSQVGIEKSHQFYKHHRIPLAYLFVLNGQ